MTDPVLGLRREPRPDVADVGSDPRLVARIRAEIAERGPMPFARFMELALYEPGHGYYRRPDTGPGLAAGDFLTAPESHPIFGAAIGRLLDQLWHALDRPDPFVVTEHGAGTGALAMGLLDGLRRDAGGLLEAIRYRPVDIEPARTAALVDRLAAAGLDRVLTLGAASGPEAGAVLANEVLDALPVHRVVRRDRLRERYVVTRGDGFAEQDGDPSTPDLAAHLRADEVQLAPDQRTEIALGVEGWLRTAAAGLHRGAAILIDYGAEAADLHGPARPDGSLRTFARHQVGDDPFVRIGRQDLTTHVCLTGLRRAAATAGLAPLGETTQGEFLAAAGAGEVMRDRLTAPDATLEDALAMRSALARLVDPRVMGGYRVVAFGRGLPGAVRLPALTRLEGSRYGIRPIRRGPAPSPHSTSEPR